MDYYFNVELHNSLARLCYNVAEDASDYSADPVPYEELRFTNNFIFAKVLQNNEELCKELIELLLDRKVSKIVSKEIEKALQASPDSKAVRFDVYFEGDESVYDLEMQTGRYADLPKRSRYYQGMVDLNILSKGSDYGELRESYIIFICTFDVFHRGLHRYTFSRICEELTDDRLFLDDGSKIVFICPGDDKDEKSPELTNFIKYISGEKVEDPFIDKLDAAVIEARKNRNWRFEYMTYQQEIEHEKYISFKEGEAKKEASMLSDLGVSKEQYERILNGELKFELKEQQDQGDRHV